MKPRADSRRPGFSPGITPATAATARALLLLGVESPAIGEPFSEAMLFGIGGGIGAGYLVQEHPTFVSLHVGGRHPSRDPIETTFRRLGLDVSVRTSPTPAAAEKALRVALDSGRPVIATIDQALLPLFWVPRELAGTTSHPVLVAAEEGEPLVYDLGPEPIRWSWPELAAARARIRGARYRLLVVGPPAPPMELEAAIRAGLADTVEGLLHPPDDSLGLASLHLWSKMLRSRTDAKGWAQLFADPIRFATALAWIDHYVEGAGSGGGNYRTLYAAFLREAAAILHDDRLLAIAALYDTLGAQWTAFNKAALPDVAPVLRDLREIRVKMRQLLTGSGGPAAAAMSELAADQWNVFVRVAGQGGVPELGDVPTFLDGVADCLDELAAAEDQAAHALAAVSGASAG